MPYVLEYPADAGIVARATAAAYGASAGEEQRRYQLEQDRWDQEMNYRLDQQAIDAVQRQQQIDDSAYQFNAGLTQQMVGQQQDYDLGLRGAGLQQQNIDQGWAQLDQQQMSDEMGLMGQQARAQATLTSRNMQIAAAKAAEAQKQNFERAMFLDEQIEKQARDGWFTSQAQYDEAKADVFRQTGIESGAIQREFMDRQQADIAAKRSAKLNSLAALTGLTPEELDSQLVDDGSGDFVLADPDFVKTMATVKANNRRMESIAEKDNAAALAQQRIQHEAKVIEQQAKARARFDALKKEYAKAHSKKRDIATNTPEVIVDPEQLPLDVLQRLSRQAMMENPPPPPIPGM